MASPTPGSRPFKGSCHCGFTKFIVFLTLPHTLPIEDDSGPKQKLYRCNCSTCHKFGIMHIRVPSGPNDFLLLSPADPFKELGDYQCFNKYIHWFFCNNCGGRCFAYLGEGENVDVDLGALGVSGETAGKQTAVWKPKTDGWGEFRGGMMYLSVNGYAVDAGQADFDMRDWTEKKWVSYSDNLSDSGKRASRTYDRPHPGGGY